MMDNVTHISIDLETLAIDRRAVILAIAIVTDQGDRLLVHPDIDEQIAEGRSIDGETLRWWLRQSDGARHAVSPSVTSTMDRARSSVRRFFADLPRDRTYFVWGNAPSFDCEILAHFLGTRPWPWHRERDVRTARMALPDRTRPETAHDAMSDAEAQLIDAARFTALAGINAGRMPRHGASDVVTEGGVDAAG